MKTEENKEVISKRVEGEAPQDLRSLKRRKEYKAQVLTRHKRSAAYLSSRYQAI